MIPMNFMKSKAGFTLVELIVVIAILGILAGIAIPAYSGYITKANEAKDTQVLSAIYTAAVSACATDPNAPAEITVTTKSGTPGDIDKVTADSVQLYPDDEDATGTTAEKQSDFTLYIGSAIGDGAEFESETYAYGATWTGGEWNPNSAPAGGNG